MTYLQIHRIVRMLIAGLVVGFALGVSRTVPRVAAQTGTTTLITSPTDGDILQGEVRIRGTAAGAAFSSAELSFAYIDDVTETWFRLAELLVPVEDGDLWAWNTTSVSDGEYLLRLKLVNLDGTQQEARVRIQVRNYTEAIVVTPTQEPTIQPPMQVDTPVVIEPSATAAVVVLPVVTPTPLPANPAALTPAAIFGGFWRGALAVLAACLLVAVMILRRRT
jgi:hypothetical protein